MDLYHLFPSTSTLSYSFISAAFISEAFIGTYIAHIYRHWVFLYLLAFHHRAGAYTQAEKSSPSHLDEILLLWRIFMTAMKWTPFFKQMTIILQVM